jgi:hypothetical protein
VYSQENTTEFDDRNPKKLKYIDAGIRWFTVNATPSRKNLLRKMAKAQKPLYDLCAFAA